MKKELLKVSMRQNAIIIVDDWIVSREKKELNETTSVLLANCSKLGYTFSEELLTKINGINVQSKLEIFNLLKEVTGVNKNWTPLVKQWDIPTGESVKDHIVTFFANVFKTKKGTTLPCGHIIPEYTFPLEKYNGCPFCGTPYEFDKLNYVSGKNKLKTLELWTESDIKKYYKGLLESPIVLDTTQIDSLKLLIGYYGLPTEFDVKIKETVMIVIDALVELNKFTEAGKLFKNPNDILRYLWFKHTGFLQIVEPKTILKRTTKNANHMSTVLNKSNEVKIKTTADLKLKYTRSECKMYAHWLNNLNLEIVKQCEIMHPKRQMWVRVIRALRLAEFSKRKDFENLAELLDVFYNKKYDVWQGRVNYFKLKSDSENTFKLLKQRPGLFARSLFSTMLWFGKDVTIAHFKEVMFEVPPRLIFTLEMYAEVYFDKNAIRSVKPLGGTNKRIPTNKLLQLYSDDDLKLMQKMVKSLSLELIKKRFENQENSNKTMFIDEVLFNMPIAIGDRSETVQDLPSALMGTKFKVEGNTIRLFLQWGKGLNAQHLDMDLSCKVAYETKSQFCSYSQLVIDGCKHSGDIQYIPSKVGTAEYIDIDLDVLTNQGAKYVSFTCNAYTSGSLEPNLVVGWMNSKYPMTISKNGVAYDPTAVQHQVRIQQQLTKGMVFGVLDIEKREIIWLEMSFGGQIVQNLDLKNTEALLNKLEAKTKIGDLLKLKAETQGLRLVKFEEFADEVYDKNWYLKSAEINTLFFE